MQAALTLRLGKGDPALFLLLLGELHLQPLLAGDQHLPGLAALVGADDPPLFHFVDDASRPGVSQAQPAC